MVDPKYLMNEDYAAFASYLKTAAIYKCPADKSMFFDKPKIRSYALNAFLNWVAPAGGGDFYLSPTYVNFTLGSDVAVATPANLLQFVDTAPNWVCHSAFAVDMRYSFYHFPSTEHDNGANLSFADGHVEYHRWRDSYTLEMAHTPFVTHENFAFTPGQDLIWLREHATVKR
ncbi:MAG: hypothetical protein EPO07_14600 [Verrucomicrobia bacterium]|nr:MAG: hypothetical protein EPO07_14600 [Verrucomicrobiota bacterium]